MSHGDVGPARGRFLTQWVLADLPCTATRYERGLLRAHLRQTRRGWPRQISGGSVADAVALKIWIEADDLHVAILRAQQTVFTLIDLAALHQPGQISLLAGSAPDPFPLGADADGPRAGGPE